MRNKSKWAQIVLIERWSTERNWSTKFSFFSLMVDVSMNVSIVVIPEGPWTRQTYFTFIHLELFWLRITDSQEPGSRCCSSTSCHCCTESTFPPACWCHPMQFISLPSCLILGVFVQTFVITGMNQMYNLSQINTQFLYPDSFKHLFANFPSTLL